MLPALGPFLRLRKRSNALVEVSIIEMQPSEEYTRAGPGVMSQRPHVVQVMFARRIILFHELEVRGQRTSKAAFDSENRERKKRAVPRRCLASRMKFIFCFLRARESISSAAFNESSQFEAIGPPQQKRPAKMVIICLNFSCVLDLRISYARVQGVTKEFPPGPSTMT